MIYSIILKPKYKNMLKVIVFTMIVAFSATLYSCQTVYTLNYIPEKLRADEELNFLEAKTKSGSTINLVGCNVTYRENYKDSLNILLVKKIDTIFIKEPGPRAYKLKKSISEINLKDISYVKVERTRFNLANTILLCAGAILLTIVIVKMINFKKKTPTDNMRFFN
jgi:hypothetical protein